MSIHYLKPPFVTPGKMEVHHLVDDFGSELILQYPLLTMDAAEIDEDVQAKMAEHCHRERTFRAKLQLRGHDVSRYLKPQDGSRKCHSCDER